MQFSFVILYHTFDRKSSIFPWFGYRDVSVLPGRMGFLMSQLSIRKLFPEGRFHSIGRFLFPGDIGNLDFQDLRSPPSRYIMIGGLWVWRFTFHPAAPDVRSTRSVFLCRYLLRFCFGFAHSHRSRMGPDRPRSLGRYGTRSFLLSQKYRCPNEHLVNLLRISFLQ